MHELGYLATGRQWMICKVFQIVQSSTIEGEDAEEMESSIVQNQNSWAGG